MRKDLAVWLRYKCIVRKRTTETILSDVCVWVPVSMRPATLANNTNKLLCWKIKIYCIHDGMMRTFSQTMQMKLFQGFHYFRSLDPERCAWLRLVFMKIVECVWGSVLSFFFVFAYFLPLVAVVDIFIIWRLVESFLPVAVAFFSLLDSANHFVHFSRLTMKMRRFTPLETLDRVETFRHLMATIVSVCVFDFLTIPCRKRMRSEIELHCFRRFQFGNWDEANGNDDARHDAEISSHSSIWWYQIKSNQIAYFLRLKMRAISCCFVYGCGVRWTAISFAYNQLSFNWMKRPPKF